MNPNEIFFQCQGKDFLELYRLVSQLPENTFGSNASRLKVELADGVKEGHCNIYPLGKVGVHLGGIVVPAQGNPRFMETIEKKVPFLMFEYNHSTYAIFERNPLL